MQHSTTVHVKRNATPIFGIFMATIAMLIAVPMLIAPQSGVALKNAKVINKAITQPIYDDIATSMSLLQSGQVERAGALLDAQRMEPLIITSCGTGSGVMESDAPTTLLMRLGRTIRTTVEREAKEGKTEDALLWVARLHTLSNQAARTSEPSFAALQMVYYMKQLAYQSEASIWQTTGNTTRFHKAVQQKGRIEAIWGKDILPEMAKANRRMNAVVIAAMHSNSDQDDEAANLTHTITPEEQTLAKSLLLSMVATIHV